MVTTPGTQVRCRKCVLNEQRPTLIARSTTHGMTGSVLHGRWMSMLSRCRSRSRTRWTHYVDRGIGVCEEWQTFDPFRDWAIANGFRPELELDRIDTKKWYSPSNCRWVSHRDNSLNTHRTIWVELEGKRMPLKEACAKLGLKYRTVHARIRDYGWTVSKALSHP